jgi:hypothetical protein
MLNYRCIDGGRCNEGEEAFATLLSGVGVYYYWIWDYIYYKTSHKDTKAQRI